MRGLFDIERKGYESIGCYTYYVAFSYYLDPGISMWNFEKICFIGMEGRIDIEKTGFESLGSWTHVVTLNFDVSWIWCWMHNGIDLGPHAWQIDRPSNRSMWNSYSFQTAGPWLGYSFSDLVAEGCFRSLNALLYFPKTPFSTPEPYKPQTWQHIRLYVSPN